MNASTGLETHSFEVQGLDPHSFEVHRVDPHSAETPGVPMALVHFSLVCFEATV